MRNAIINRAAVGCITRRGQAGHSMIHHRLGRATLRESHPRSLDSEADS
jgi:hypothetical protein